MSDNEKFLKKLVEFSIGGKVCMNYPKCMRPVFSGTDICWECLEETIKLCEKNNGY
jgi:hypothetical protein